MGVKIFNIVIKKIANIAALLIKIKDAQTVGIALKEAKALFASILVSLVYLYRAKFKKFIDVRKLILIIMSVLILTNTVGGKPNKSSGRLKKRMIGMFYSILMFLQKKQRIFKKTWVRLKVQKEIELFWIFSVLNKEDQEYQQFYKSLVTYKVITLLLQGVDVIKLIEIIETHHEELAEEYQYWLDRRIKHKFYNAYVNYRNNINEKDTWIKTFFFIEKEKDFDIVEFYQNIIGRITFYGKDEISFKGFQERKPIHNFEYQYIYPGNRLNEAICLDKEVIESNLNKSDFLYLHDLNDVEDKKTYSSFDNKICFISYDKKLILKKEVLGFSDKDIPENLYKKAFEHYMHARRKVKISVIECKLITEKKIENYKKIIEDNYDEENFKKYKIEETKKDNEEREKKSYNDYDSYYIIIS